MQTKKITMAVGAAAASAAIALTGAPVSSATDVQPFGSQEILTNANGAVDTGYTVKDLRPSNDKIPYPVHGRLYEATVTVTAKDGTVTPIIPLFNARAADGTTYRVLANVATPQGLDANTLPQGASSTGKIYFDVTGTPPDSVVYNNGITDILIWKG